MYVVTGITGHTASAAARALLDAGLAVRGTSRDPSRATALAELGAEIVAADLADRASLARAFEGATAAYVLVPPQWTAPDYFAATEVVIDAIVGAIDEARVPRVVALSSIGVQAESGTGPIRSLKPLEARLAGRPGVTLLRPSYFVSNLASVVEPVTQGQLPVFWSPSTAVEIIDTRDIGAEVADQLQIAPAEAPDVVQLSGPAPATFAEVAATFGALLGREVTTQPLPPDAIIGVLKAQGAGHIAELYAEMNAHVDEGLGFEPSRPVKRTQTPLKASLQSLLASVRGA